MSKWLGLGVIVFLTLVISGAYYQGYQHAKLVSEVDNAKATQDQLNEQREIQNAVNRLDDTGLRDAISGVPTRKGK